MADNLQLTAPGRARVGGSGLTLYRFSLTNNNTGEAGNILAFCRQVTHQAPVAVGAGVTAIHPMDRQYPTELVTPQAQGMGTLVLEFYEPTDKMFWEQINGLAGYQDLVDIFVGVASHYGGDNSKSVDVSKYIIDPSKQKVTAPVGSDKAGVSYASAAGNQQHRTITYHGCVVSALDDGEAVDITTLEVLKRLTLNYRYWTYNNKS